jgi:hypothetical protein
MPSNQELTDMHFVYGLAEGDAAVARRLYQERYSRRRFPDRKTFVSIHRPFCEHGNFAPRVANRGRQRSATPAVEADILEVSNEIPGNSIRRISMQVGIAHSIVWRVLREQRLYLPSAACTGFSLQDYPGSYKSVVQILTSLPLC